MIKKLYIILGLFMFLGKTYSQNKDSIRFKQEFSKVVWRKLPSNVHPPLFIYYNSEIPKNNRNKSYAGTIVFKSDSIELKRGALFKISFDSPDSLNKCFEIMKECYSRYRNPKFKYEDLCYKFFELDWYFMFKISSTELVMIGDKYIEKNQESYKLQRLLRSVWGEDFISINYE